MRYTLARLCNFLFGWEYIMFRGCFHHYDQDRWKIRRVLNYNGLFFIRMCRLFEPIKLIKIDAWTSNIQDIGLSKELCKKWYPSS